DLDLLLGAKRQIHAVQWLGYFRLQQDRLETDSTGIRAPGQFRILSSGTQFSTKPIKPMQISAGLRGEHYVSDQRQSHIRLNVPLALSLDYSGKSGKLTPSLYSQIGRSQGNSQQWGIVISPRIGLQYFPTPSLRYR